MPRRVRRAASRRTYKVQKYSNETVSYTVNLEKNAGAKVSASYIVVPSSTIFGVRKTKNYTMYIDVCSHDNAPATLCWALVFVPSGQNPGDVNFSGPNVTAYYEPNQNVIAAGIATNKELVRVKTRLARNLSSGDYIALILCAPPNSQYTADVTFTCNYAIAF